MIVLVIDYFEASPLTRLIKSSTLLSLEKWVQQVLNANIREMHGPSDP